MKAGCSRVTHPSATILSVNQPKSQSEDSRSTWMCYARRQRLSWARIKLSKKLFHWYLVPVIYFLELNLLLFYFFPWVFIIRNSNNVYSLLGIVRVNSLYCHVFWHDFSSFVVQFSRSNRFPLSRTALLLYHFILSLSIPFWKFF